MKGFEGDITEADDAFLAIVGYSRDDFEHGRMNWRAMTPPEFLHLDEAGIQQAATSGGFTAPYQKEFIRRDGTRVPVLLVCAFIPDTPGQWMGYVVDLSPPPVLRARHSTATMALADAVPQELYARLVNELVRERTRMIAMLDNTNALVWAVDREYRLLSANHAFQSAQGKTSGRALEIGESVLAPDFGEELVTIWRAWYDRALAGERFTAQIESDTPDGMLYHQCLLSPIHDAHLGIVGVTAVSQDATARTNAERALQASVARFRTLTATLPLGVFLTDGAGLCVYANPRLAAIWDLPPGEMLGTGYARHIHPDDATTLLASWSEAIARGTDLDAEYRLRLPDGTVRHVRVRIAPIYESGTLTGFVGTADDETERRALAHRVRQRDKMESLGTLAGGIAHDFNNMLGVVLGYTELAQLDADDPAAVRENLAEIRTASLRARDLVRQILTFSRHSESSRAPVDLRALTAESLKLLRATLPATITVTQSLPDLSVPVVGDASALQQIIMNLCTNAEYAMRATGGGTLGVTLRTACGPDEARVAVLSISDTGNGIDAQVRERLFEPFFTTKPVGDGTGMGLAVVHGIVRGHGGSISIDSAPGAGATFHITIPLGDGTAPAPTVITSRPRGVGTVLLVEDEAALARFTTQALERAGYDVVHCADGQEALERFEASPNAFDLVLSDVAMPRYTGDRLAEALRGLRPALPVILMTGFSHSVTAESAAALGVTLLAKPFGAQDLTDAVRAALTPAPVTRARTSSSASSPR